MHPPYRAIDPHTLLSACDNDLAMFRTLARMFLDTAPAMYARMANASAAPAFVGACHALRGVTVLVGAQHLTALLAALERDAQAGALPLAAALAPVQALFEQACAEVGHSIDAFPGPP